MNMSASDVSKEAANMILLGTIQPQIMQMSKLIDFCLRRQFRFHRQWVNSFYGTSRSVLNFWQRVSRRVAKYSWTWSVQFSESLGLHLCALLSPCRWHPSRYTISHSTPEVIPQLLCAFRPAFRSKHYWSYWQMSSCLFPFLCPPFSFWSSVSCRALVFDSLPTLVFILQISVSSFSSLWVLNIPQLSASANWPKSLYSSRLLGTSRKQSMVLCVWAHENLVINSFSLRASVYMALCS